MFNPKISWKRLEEIYPGDKTVFDGGIDPTDIEQGSLGNCWFLAALSCLTEKPELIKRCFKTPEISKEGKYIICLYKDGQPVEVVIDSYLPFLSGKNYSCATKPGKTWVALLEKAYAKQYSSYDNLKSGECHHAFQDLPGFPSGQWKNFTEDSNLWEKLTEGCSDHRILLTAAIDSRKEGHGVYKMKSKGLLCDHAYSVLEAKEYKPRRIKLIKLRNPWGKFESLLDFNDKSSKWTSELKKFFGLHVDLKDGEFWISFEDFKDIFDTVSYCVCDDWDDYREPFNFVADDGAVVNDCFKVDVPDGTKLSYIGVHQKDEREMGSKPYIDISALIIKEPEMECISALDSELDRWAQSNVDLGPGNYTILPFSTGAHFKIRKNDKSRKAVLVLHYMNPSKKNYYN